MEMQAIISTCNIIWKQKVPLKVQFFGWLHFRRRHGASTPEEAILRHFGRVCHVYRG